MACWLSQKLIDELQAKINIQHKIAHIIFHWIYKFFHAFTYPHAIALTDRGRCLLQRDVAVTRRLRVALVPEVRRTSRQAMTTMTTTRIRTSPTRRFHTAAKKIQFMPAQSTLMDAMTSRMFKGKTKKPTRLYKNYLQPSIYRACVSLEHLKEKKKIWEWMKKIQTINKERKKIRWSDPFLFSIRDGILLDLIVWNF